MFDTHDYTKGWDAQNTKRTDKLEDVQNNGFTYQLLLPWATPLHPDPDWLEYTRHVTIIDDGPCQVRFRRVLLPARWWPLPSKRPRQTRS